MFIVPTIWSLAINGTTIMQVIPESSNFIVRREFVASPLIRSKLSITGSLD